MAGFPNLAILKLQIFKKEVRKSDMSILSTANLMKQYGKEPNIVNALNGIDISIEQGQCGNHRNLRQRQIHPAQHVRRP